MLIIISKQMRDFCCCPPEKKDLSLIIKYINSDDPTAYNIDMGHPFAKSP